MIFMHHFEAQFSHFSRSVWFLDVWYVSFPNLLAKLSIYNYFHFFKLKLKILIEMMFGRHFLTVDYYLSELSVTFITWRGWLKMGHLFVRMWLRMFAQVKSVRCEKVLIPSRRINYPKLLKLIGKVPIWDSSVRVCPLIFSPSGLSCQFTP